MEAAVSPSIDLPIDLTKSSSERKKSILSIDGGGVRGIIPAMVLQAIEERTKRATCDLFDLVAGASAGSIVAAGLTLAADDKTTPKFDAKSIVNFFENKSSQIFPFSYWKYTGLFGRLWHSEYGYRGIESVLENLAGEAKLKDALTEITIPSYEFTHGKAWHFRRMDARRLPELSNLTMSDVVRASSAAPTYFDPKVISPLGAFIDGGTYENNPAAFVLTEAEALFGHTHNYLIVSLGCGHNTIKIPYEGSQGWGISAWGRPIIPLMMQATSQEVEDIMATLFSGKNHTFFRFQTEIPDAHSAIDDASKENLTWLKETAEEMILDHEEDLRQICNTLTFLADAKEETHKVANELE